MLRATCTSILQHCIAILQYCSQENIRFDCKDYLGQDGMAWYIFLFQAIDQEVKTEIEDAVEHSKTDPEIALDELYQDVYSGGMKGYGVRGCDPMTVGPHN